MDIHKNLWKSMKIDKIYDINENLWKSMKINQNPWNLRKSMQIYENPCKSIRINNKLYKHQKQGSSAEAKPVNSPHPVRGHGVIESEFKSFKIYEFQISSDPAPAAEPSKKYLQNHSKIRPWKKTSKVEKNCSPRPPNGPQGRPKSANFCKKCLPKRR